jgi:hypothetical protein
MVIPTGNGLIPGGWTWFGTKKKLNSAPACWRCPWIYMPADEYTLWSQAYLMQRCCFGGYEP